VKLEHLCGTAADVQSSSASGLKITVGGKQTNECITGTLSSRSKKDG
jgi:hypothetical protein